uniref:Uncharacterized protein n=1 Tax=Kalanchoe fedtschenkoi TaxID=63787 RepID=A0A7N0RB50_KALFE
MRSEEPRTFVSGNSLYHSFDGSISLETGFSARARLVRGSFLLAITFESRMAFSTQAFNGTIFALSPHK